MILESTVGIGGMSLGDAGSWTSLIGLVITLLTFFMTTNVNQKVNGILKQKKDRKFFEKKAPTVIQNLNMMLELAEEDDKKSNYWSATKQQTRINNAIEIVNSSWEAVKIEEDISASFNAFFCRNCIKIKCNCYKIVDTLNLFW